MMETIINLLVRLIVQYLAAVVYTQTPESKETAHLTGICPGSSVLRDAGRSYSTFGVLRGKKLE
ncbi:hypothetical protein [Neolewinella sp.]|uniref:hypothetical protein n=1 Tax=Neolewinella sp. TaxID=2993543 RepID=UPI003B51DC60